MVGSWSEEVRTSLPTSAAKLSLECVDELEERVASPRRLLRTATVRSDATGNSSGRASRALETSPRDARWTHRPPVELTGPFASRQRRSTVSAIENA